ncbi:hypothetical protein [Halomarina rubra]|uniref:Halobacterial output domain-containing protein n=1 Tax=Halomarina rubra TaxID=2071873 RepID=A0ABD6B0G7_9EURY|nr:hypothetical protein [Halomarina rubra]
MSTETTQATTSRVEHRIAAVDMPGAERVLRAVRGEPAAPNGRDYLTVLFRQPNLVACLHEDEDRTYLQRQPDRSAFQRAIVRDGHVEVTDFGVSGASIILGGDVELLAAEAVDVFEQPDADRRGQGFGDVDG